MPKSDECSSGLHGFCIPCDCQCHGGSFFSELLDLIKLMPDSQTQKIIDFIMEMRKIRKEIKDNEPIE